MQQYLMRFWDSLMGVGCSLHASLGYSRKIEKDFSMIFSFVMTLQEGNMKLCSKKYSFCEGNR
jgi:hypothetical protein